MDRHPETIPELLARRALRDADKSWLFFESDSWSFRDVSEAVERYATGLAERGVGRGDTVAIAVGNRPETLFTWFAANRLGAIAMPLNPAFKKPELEALFALASPRIVVGGEGVDPGALAASGRGVTFADVQADDVAVLIATSGTTGAPKLIPQTHRTYALTAEAFPWWLGLSEEDRVLVALPLFHINAQAYSTMAALGENRSLALLPKFSASRFWQDAARLGATQFNAVGAMIHILLEREPQASDREHRLRLTYAALALPEDKHRGFEKRFGVKMLVGYGMSETTFGTIWPRDRAPKYGTMGALRQHPRLGVINYARVVREDGADAAADETGELWLANPAVPESLLVDGWLRTGDLVRRDGEGDYTFVSRKKEIIRRRGENVAAAEVEGVLVSHPSVLEAAVVGVPSALGEEEIVAYVAPRAGLVIDIEALTTFCRERLADFKVPSRVFVLDKLPRTATERIAKHLLPRD